MPSGRADTCWHLLRNYERRWQYARTPELIEFAKKHNLVFITVAALVAYRKKHEKMVHRVAEAALPSKYGNFRIIAYENDLDSQCHVAIVKGDIAGKKGCYGTRTF